MRLASVTVVMLLAASFAIGVFGAGEFDDTDSTVVCTRTDADYDGDIDLADFAVYQNCFTGPDPSGWQFDVLGNWDVFRGHVESPTSDYMGFVTFLSSGVVLIDSPWDYDVVVYAFNGTRVEYHYTERLFNGFSDHSVSLTYSTPNRMIGVCLSDVYADGSCFALRRP